MCGIYGITEHNPEFIQKYINVCKHRGPDGQSIWEDPKRKITLGHNLLSIMSEPKLSTQPWRTPKGNYLVYNGEIFNYYELKQKYKDHGFGGTTGCDTELLAWGLDKFGVKFIDEIDSMHGFAYYRVEENELWLSRDHAGIKPLFYSEVKQGLVFGSECKGLLPMVPNSNKIDKLAASFMARTGINALRNTFFTGIKKVLAGETLIYNVGNKKFTSTHRFVIPPLSNQEFNREEFRLRMRDTVEMCSIGRRKLGVFLSGGLDSSMIAYELQQIKGHVNTFTNRMNPNVKSDEDFNSDANVALAFAQQKKFNHTEVICTPEIFMNAWEDSVYYMEQPVYNPSNAMYCHTNKFLSEKGIVVTMAGDMGDEILGGYPKYWKMRNKDWLRKQLNKKYIETWDDVLQLWLQRIKRPITSIIPNPIDDKVLLEEFKNSYPEELFNPLDPIGSHMALDCVAQVPEEMFNRNDKYGMAYSMEGRFPLATKKFMRYCLGMHTDIKIGVKKTSTKILAKKAYQGILPEGITKKAKTGWTVPIGLWLSNNVNQSLSKFYTDSMGRGSVVPASAKSGKGMVPVWQLQSWKQKFNMEF